MIDFFSQAVADSQLIDTGDNDDGHLETDPME